MGAHMQHASVSSRSHQTCTSCLQVTDVTTNPTRTIECAAAGGFDGVHALLLQYLQLVEHREQLQCLCGGAAETRLVASAGVLSMGGM